MVTSASPPHRISTVNSFAEYPPPRPSHFKEFGRETNRLHQHGTWSIVKLYNLPPNEIAGCDVAEMNLISAYGLKGTNDFDIGAMLALLDSWAKIVNAYTVKRIGRFRENREKYGTLAQFRVTAIILALSRECGVHYNPDRIKDPDNFDDPADSFIHGLLCSKRQGTCATLPVLLTAIGRRLGYPLKLVLAPRHCFCRWDTPTERFNIEYHEQGMNTHPDSYYKKHPQRWPATMHERERIKPQYLISLAPQQELASFAHTRAVLLSYAGRNDEALKTMHVAYRLWPTHLSGVWTTHLTTISLYPEKKWPDFLCEETTGPEIFQRLIKEKGVQLRPALGYQPVVKLHFPLDADEQSR